MNLNIIALKTTKHSDTQTILTAYSRELGRVSFSLPASGGKAAARVRALTMPFGIIECMSDARPGREIMPLRQPVPTVTLSSLHADPVKRMVAMFLAEILSVALPAGETDASLYDFIVAAVRLLDVADSRRTANFHICFLLNLARHLGIEPDVSTFVPGSLLDVADGRWRTTKPLHRNYLPPEKSAVAHKLMRMTFENMHRFRLNRDGRNAILDAILDYYSLHYVTMRRLRSLDILRALL